MLAMADADLYLCLGFMAFFIALGIHQSWQERKERRTWVYERCYRCDAPIRIGDWFVRETAGEMTGKVRCMDCQEASDYRFEKKLDDEPEREDS